MKVGRLRADRVLYAYAGLLYLFIYAPVIYLVLFSFNDSLVATPPWRGLTFEWYRRVAENSDLRLAFWNSLSLGLVTSAVAVTLGMLMAFAFRWPFRAKGAVFGLLLLLIEVLNPGFFIAVPGGTLAIMGSIGLVAPELMFGSSMFYPLETLPSWFQWIARINPLTWLTARSLNILNPASSVAGLPDDGIVNTGKYGTTNGTPLIPITGIALSSPNPYGSGDIITSRYFVKVTDNNGEVTERTSEGVAPGQPDDPFRDADGTIIVRSMGVAGTIRETGGAAVRANSVSVYEMRFRRSRSFSFDSPLTLQGDTIVPSASSMFNGAAFDIDGGSNNYGIATIDPNLANGTPVSQVTSQLSKAQEKKVTGKGGQPSVGDITTQLTGDALNLLNAGYLWNFVQYEVPTFADGIYQGKQSWSGNSQPYVGFFDPSKELTEPVQDPQVTLVNGDLDIGGGVKGGGLLVVTGKLSGSGSMTWNGLIFVIGKGEVDFSGMNVSMTGGLYVVNVQPDASGVPQFGTTKFTMSGESKFAVNSDTTKMSTVIIPPRQISFRQVNSLTDP